jgi:hypothetical protein
MDKKSKSSYFFIFQHLKTCRQIKALLIEKISTQSFKFRLKLEVMSAVNCNTETLSELLARVRNLATALAAFALIAPLSDRIKNLLIL